MASKPNKFTNPGNFYQGMSKNFQDLFDTTAVEIQHYLTSIGVSFELTFIRTCSVPSGIDFRRSYLVERIAMCVNGFE